MADLICGTFFPTTVILSVAFIQISYMIIKSVCYRFAGTAGDYLYILFILLFPVNILRGKILQGDSKLMVQSLSVGRGHCYMFLYA